MQEPRTLVNKEVTYTIATLALPFKLGDLCESCGGTWTVQPRELRHYFITNIIIIIIIILLYE